MTLFLLLGVGCMEYDLGRMDVADVFYQSPPMEVDLLLLVDNSFSMAPFQTSLAQHFSGFVYAFDEAQTDYQIGVVTTTVANPVQSAGSSCTAADIARIPSPGVLAGGSIITPDTEGAAEVFSRLVNVGVCGSGMEMGLEAARLALVDRLQDGTNAGFLRDEASLSLVFVSDEEDSSPMPVEDYLSDFRALKGQVTREAFNASALVVTSQASCTAAQSEHAAVGDRYLDLARQTQGATGDICQDDFEQLVRDLSLRASRLVDTFYLSTEPAADSLEVTVDGAVLPCEEGAWSYSRVTRQGVDTPAVVFHDPPPPGAQVAVRFLLGTGEPASFCQGGTP